MHRLPAPVPRANGLEMLPGAAPCLLSGRRRRSAPAAAHVCETPLLGAAESGRHHTPRLPACCCFRSWATLGSAGSAVEAMLCSSRGLVLPVARTTAPADAHAQACGDCAGPSFHLPGLQACCARWLASREYRIVGCGVSVSHVHSSRAGAALLAGPQLGWQRSAAEGGHALQPAGQAAGLTACHSAARSLVACGRLAPSCCSPPCQAQWRAIDD
jgi:hypothetical protein